jgi:hypothetical protein
MKSAFLCLALSLASLTSCVTTKESLDYSEAAASGLRKGGKANVTVSLFQDRRGMEPNYLGQVRPGGGLTFKKIETNIPVVDVVKNTFGYGLHIRGMAGQPGKSGWRIGGIIREFNCDQVVRSGSNVELLVMLYQPGAETPAFRKTYQAEKTETSLAIGDTNLLKTLASSALQEVVDRALDDPELRAYTDRKY